MEDRPIGFRFYPTEEELVGFYLHNQLQGQRNDINKVIPVIHINGIEPWNLPPLAGELCRGETGQWFFFVPRQEREARGGKPNRTTASGYWKATGSPGYVYSSHNNVIGVKKTMVFYEGKAPTGRKTKWKMHEYRAMEFSNHNQSTTAATPPPKLRSEFSLCRVYVTSGSFRAFERGPPRVMGLRLDGDVRGGGSSGPQHEDGASRELANGSSSCEASHSGGGVETGWPSIGCTNWNASGNEVDEPMWEWEQLNWL